MNGMSYAVCYVFPFLFIRCLNGCTDNTTGKLFEFGHLSTYRSKVI